MSRLAVALFLTSVSFAEQPEETLQKAIQAHQSGDMPAAIEGYREYLKARPPSVPVLSNLGAALAREGRFEQAIAEYRRALELDPSNPGVSLNLALAYYKTGEINRAANLFAALRALQPANRQALLLLADCRLQLGENAKVVELLAPLDDIAQADPAIAYLLGAALLRDGQLVRGQLLLDRILKNGDSAEARLLLGASKLNVQDYAAALPDLARAVELKPDLPSAHAYYGLALMATGDEAGAAQAFRRELAHNPNDFDSNLNLAALLKQDQSYEEARQRLDRALRVRPGELRARYQIATIDLAEGQTEAARRQLEEIIQAAPKFQEAHVSLATAYFRLKRKADGDRERALVLKLNAEAQSKQPGAVQ